MSNKNVLVLSHPRSGTHFLINTIALNFPYYSHRRKIIPDFRGVPKYYGNYFRKHGIEPRVHKDHLQSYSLRDSWKYLNRDWHIFYIIREGRDMFASLFRYYVKHQGWVKANNMDQFLKASPSNMERVRKVAQMVPETILDQWIYHLESWVYVKEPCVHFVFYEDLVERFEAVVRHLGKILVMENEKIVKPDKAFKVVDPGPGIIGNYKNFFSEADNRYFLRKTIEVRKKIEYLRSMSLDQRLS